MEKGHAYLTEKVVGSKYLKHVKYYFYIIQHQLVFAFDYYILHINKLIHSDTIEPKSGFPDFPTGIPFTFSDKTRCKNLSGRSDGV